MLRKSCTSYFYHTPLMITLTALTMSKGDGNQHLPQLAINKSADSDHLHPAVFKELAKKGLEPIQKSLNPREVLENQKKMNVLLVFLKRRQDNTGSRLPA